MSAKGFTQNHLDSVPELSPQGIFDKVYDYQGNTYNLADLRADSASLVAKAIHYIPCGNGYFHLYFEQGSGMENLTDQTHILRRDILCQVMNDLSNYLPQPNPANPTPVNIWVRDFTTANPPPPAGVLAYASGFYVLPIINGVTGIVDNQIWKTIHSGLDAYTNNVFLPGNTVTFTFTLNNTSNSTLTGFSIQDVLSPEFLATTVGGGIFAFGGGNTVSANALSLNTGINTFSFTVQIDPTIPINACTPIVTNNCGQLYWNAIASPCSSCLSLPITIGPPYLSNTSASVALATFPNLFTSGTFTIDGTFVVDIPTSWQGCNIQCTSGASILVPSGQNLDIINTQINECSDMWRGIRVSSGGAVRTNSSQINGAEHAINAVAGSFIDLMRTQFSRNYIGVRMVGTNTNNVLNHNIRLCRFQSGASLPFPYVGQATIPSTSQTFAGILSERIANVSVASVASGPNTFDNLNCGIRVFEGDLNVKFARFTNIQPDPVYTAQVVALGASFTQGTGIYINNMNNLNPLHQFSFSGYGNMPTSITTFEDCQTGVLAENTATQFEKHHLLNVRFGIGVYHTRDKISIRRNYIEALIHGIMLWDDEYSHTQLKVQDNDIFVSQTTPYTGSTGIFDFEYVSNNNPNPVFYQDAWIYGNRIDVGQGRTGIALTQVGKMNVVENEIEIMHYLPNDYGIYISDGMLHNINCNTITGQLPPEPCLYAPNGGVINPYDGIYVLDNPKSTIACNSIDQTCNGIRFDGPMCNETYLKGNEMNNHAVGLFLGSTAIIGPQGGPNIGDAHNGNKWLATSYTTFGAVSLNINVFPSTIYIQPSPGTYSPPSINSALGWFQYNNPNPPYDCATANPLPCAAPSTAIAAFAGEGMTLEEGDKAIAKEYLAIADFEAESNAFLDRALYEKMRTDSSIWISDTTFTTFYDSINQTVNKDLANLQKSKTELLEKDSLVSNPLLDSLWLQIVYIDSLLTDSTLANRNYWENEKQSKIVERQTLLSGLELDRVLQDSLKNIGVDSLHIAYNSLLTNELYEENERIVNDIYLQTYAQNNYDLSEQQQEALANIAEQCPLSGGSAVFQARSMLFPYRMQHVYDDENTCSSEGYAMRHTQQTELNSNHSLTLHPNPSKDKITISFDDLQENGSTLVIYDLLGNVVKRIVIPANIQQYEFSIEGIASGTYLYFWNQKERGKLIIIN